MCVCAHIFCRNEGVRKTIREIDAEELVLILDKGSPEFSNKCVRKKGPLLPRIIS